MNPKRKLALAITGVVLAATIITALEVLVVYNSLYQFASSAPYELKQTCGTVGPDGNDVDGLIGITNPTSVAIDVSWSFEFMVNTLAFGAVSFHVPAHGISYVFVRFFNLGQAYRLDLGLIHPSLYQFKASYHVLVWFFTRHESSTNGTLSVPFSPPESGWLYC
ncbi:hypothetical protein E6H34_00605 [Candidatus Bathyarchaeota archaeon]|nr:MAG: hypothetical protein E6H34_00605 [Candidatus Bathyarchaeota archaeon]